MDNHSGRGTPSQQTLDDALVVLNERFALDRFLDGQSEIIGRLLAGRNVAAVFPTGGGKSLCYQLPSQMFEGTTVVVSPLIALMKDQCDALARRGVTAARLDSSLSTDEFRNVMAGIRGGTIKLLYVSPERFFNERFLATMGSLQVSLFAIDEAHCISQWGHNFRPDYLKLASLAKELAAERVLALTATATPSVLADIREAFEIHPQDAIRTPFHRPNLQLRSCLASDRDQYERLRSHLADRPRGSTLVYVTLQRTAEEVAEELAKDGFAATAYHAGMNSDLRSTIQQDFLESEQGIVVATIAFGMGIDKSNIRYVYHYNPPKSLEAYAQEIGRAGRDGKDAVCELLLVPEDRIVLENFSFGDTPTRQGLKKLLELLIGQPETFYVSHYKLSAETDIRILVVRTLLTYLELDGYVQATSPRYDSYKIKPLVPSKPILEHYTGDQRSFVSGVLSSLTKGRTWFTLNMVMAARKMNVERSQIIQVIDEMVERKWLEVKVSELVHGYRWLRRIDSSNAAILVEDLYDRLVIRERASIDRLDDVFRLATAESCQAGLLSEHFGETLDEPCGRCSFCLGDGPWSIPDPQTRTIGTSAKRVIEELADEYPHLLMTARGRAKFLCGLSSPGLVRAKLSRHPSFGVCDRLPFADVLTQVGGTDPESFDS